MPMSHLKQSLEGAVASTQPIVYGVAGVTFMGFSVNDWILIGTGILLVLNLTIAAHKLYCAWRKK